MSPCIWPDRLSWFAGRWRSARALAQAGRSLSPNRGAGFPVWVEGGGTEDAGKSFAAVSIPDHFLRRSTPLLSARSRPSAGSSLGMSRACATSGEYTNGESRLHCARATSPASAKREVTSAAIQRLPRPRTTRPGALVAARQSRCWPAVPPCSHTCRAPRGNARCSCRCRRYSR